MQNKFILIKGADMKKIFILFFILFSVIAFAKEGILLKYLYVKTFDNYFGKEASKICSTYYCKKRVGRYILLHPKASREEIVKYSKNISWWNSIEFWTILTIFSILVIASVYLNWKKYLEKIKGFFQKLDKPLTVEK